MKRHALIAVACLCAGPVSAEPRDVQIRSIDFQAGVIELRNFGTGTEPLDGWRFCSHDENQIRQYSGTTGLNGRSLGPGESLFIHFNNDAPAEPNRVNRSALGGLFAVPLTPAVYALGLYWPNGGVLAFASADDLVDHLQWSIDGVDNTTADERSTVAQTAGLWTSESAWIVTAADSLSIVLLDESNGRLHGPTDYQVNGPTGDPCTADVNGDGALTPADFSSWVAAFNAQAAECDQNGDAACTPADFSAWIVNFNAGCP
jgi:hypothetical protein